MSHGQSAESWEKSRWAYKYRTHKTENDQVVGSRAKKGASGQGRATQIKIR